MTREEVMAMADDRLNAWAWALLYLDDPIPDLVSRGGMVIIGGDDVLIPDYVNNIRAAWELVEELASRRMFPSIYQEFDYGWYCDVIMGGPDDKVSVDDDLSAARAITRAFVLTMSKTREIDWKLKVMQILDAVGEHEGVWFDPWPGISREEQAEIEREYNTYKLKDRPISRTRRNDA